MKSMASLPPDPSASLNTTVFEQLRNRAPMLVSHGLKVIVFCTVIALVLWLAKPDQRLDAQLVYSFATGITSWLTIDIGRFFIDRASPFAFPRGWRGLALILGGVCIGFVVGTLTGDTYTGRSTFGLLANQPRFFFYLFLSTLSMGVGISYFFYATGKSSYLAQQLETSRLQAAEAQLKLLQTQMEPHMLFNTLANLRALMVLDPARATDMLDRLVAYLRATLQASRATTHPLRAEFDRLQDYLELMSGCAWAPG